MAIYMNDLAKEQRNTLIENNLNLVENMARKEASIYSYNYDDIYENFVSAGYLGLVEAAQKYNPDKSNDFTKCAKQYIFKYIADEKKSIGRQVRLPDSVIEDYSKYIKAANIYGDDVSKIMEATHMSAKRIQTVLTQIQAEQSLDGLIDEEDDTPFIDTIGNGRYGPDTMITKSKQNDLYSKLDDYIELLDENEQQVINLLFFTSKPEEMRKNKVTDTELTPNDIGKMLHMSKKEVNKIKEQALRKLKELMSHECDSF